MRSPSRLAAAAALAGALLVAPARAHAGNDSVVTLAVGTHLVVAREASIDAGAPAATAVGQGVNLRLRLLRYLGAELSVESTGADPRANVAAPSFQLSGLVYLFAHTRFSAYLVAGLGASAIGDVISVGGATTSYHAGLGVEVGVTRHFVLSAEYRQDVPGYAAVRANMIDSALATGRMPPLGDYYHLDTFRVNVGLRYYL